MLVDKKTEHVRNQYYSAIASQGYWKNLVVYSICESAIFYKKGCFFKNISGCVSLLALNRFFKGKIKQSVDKSNRKRDNW